MWCIHCDSHLQVSSYAVLGNGTELAPSTMEEEEGFPGGSVALMSEDAEEEFLIIPQPEMARLEIRRSHRLSPSAGPTPPLLSISDWIASKLTVEHIVWFTWLLSVTLLTSICAFCFDWVLYLI